MDQIPRAYKGNVDEKLHEKNERGKLKEFCELLDLNEVVRSRNVEALSGGELQRFAIGTVCIQDKTVYMFDEPSSYLDVKQRLKAAEAIRYLIEPGKYIIVVEHDLAVLDYLSDFVCCLYGTPGCYGVVTMPFSVREGRLEFGVRSETVPKNHNKYRIHTLFPHRYQHFPGRFRADRKSAVPRELAGVQGQRERDRRGNQTHVQIRVPDDDQETGRL